MNRNWHISRRTMLRGLGVAVALPLLEAMAPGRAGADEPAVAGGKEHKFRPPRTPVRMVVMNLPCGTYHREWQPDGGTAALGQLKPMLAPLQAFAPDLFLLSNLWNKAATADPIAHYANEACFLTGMPVHKTAGADVNVNGVSMDQVAARCTGTVTRFPSLHLNMQAPVGGVDSGWARMYNNQLSWSTPTTPVPNEIDPKRAFERLFRAPGQKSSGEGVAMALSDDDKKSVLDYVTSDTRSLKLKIGIGDQRKIDEYLTSVRDVEKQLDREIKEMAKERRIDPAAVRAVGQLGGQAVAFDGRDHTKRTRLMLDILTLALWTDSTRVATFMFGNERNDINYSFIEGVKGTHHEMSHYTESAEKLVQYRKINLWHADQVAYLLGRMKGIKESNGGSLLDNSVVMFGGTLNDGNGHGRENLPIMLAGRGGGVLKPGRHVSFPNKTPLCNLFLTMMQCIGVQADSFADSTGVLAELAKG